MSQSYQLKTTLISFLIIMMACGTPQALLITPEPLPLVLGEELEIRDLDTLFVQPDDDFVDAEAGDQAPYQASAQRHFDLMHTALDLRFDWANETIIGRASLTLQPYFYPTTELVLDAKDFDIESIALKGYSESLTYHNDGEQLTISLPRMYRRGEELTVEIHYRATPKASGGSTAITSDQGLFFINPRGDEPGKPQQIWTQGETEFNSRWFPTIDKPNERCTQDVLLTVESHYTTLSNGVLVSSVENEDGTRTDRWVMDQPHAPYLFMLAIGEYAVEKDMWRGKEVSYYVEPRYRDDARDIFAHTTEMLTFFSDLTGIEYPWQKYAQVVVRDYVSGAMENTTSTIFGDFVQKHKRELIDNHNDRIVAHELMHHWFGDYVTCESWSNLTLNEGFANYAEYLWFEHKYGPDHANHHRLGELEGYLSQASSNRFPLIRYRYQDKEDMFDQHSYNKGGLVLHMLRHLIGDDAFKAGMQTYLTDNAYQAVEVHHLRLAFEKVTGRDLNQFFDQWFLSPGHPEVQISSNWIDDHTGNGYLQIDVQQVQTPANNLGVFEFPLEVELVLPNGRKERQNLSVNQRSQRFDVQVSARPVVVIPDPDRILLAVIQMPYATDAYAHLYDPSHHVAIRLEAVEAMAHEPEGEALLLRALQDPFWAVRQQALEGIDWEETGSELAAFIKRETHSQVKANALALLGEYELSDYTDLVTASINTVEPYPVVAAAISTLDLLDPEACLVSLVPLLEEKQSDIVAAISGIYARSKDVAHLDYFERHLASVDGLPALTFYDHLDNFLPLLRADQVMGIVAKIEALATDRSPSPYTRISATRTLINIMRGRTVRILSESQLADVKQSVDRIVAAETNAQIRQIYRSFLGG